MKTSSLLIAILCLFLNYGFAHDANKAFFKIEQKEDVVVVEAEFPWSIRSSLLIAFPDLELSRKQEDYDVALFDYLNNHLIITNGLERLPLLSVNKTVSQGHSHQANYILTFKGASFNKITNSIMCNLTREQTNYHELLLQTKSVEYITTNTATSFEIQFEEKNNKKVLSFYYLAGIIALLLGFVLFYFARKKASRHTSAS